jgi:hypothetical protein
MSSSCGNDAEAGWRVQEKRRGALERESVGAWIVQHQTGRMGQTNQSVG